MRGSCVPVCAYHLALKGLSFFIIWLDRFMGKAPSLFFHLTHSHSSAQGHHLIILPNKTNSNSLIALSLLSLLQLPRLSSGNLESLQKSFLG